MTMNLTELPDQALNKNTDATLPRPKLLNNGVLNSGRPS